MARILVVDDNFQLRAYIRTCLNQLGFSQITEAANGRKALEIVQKAMPDIITLDWNMPEMDGLDFLLALRQLENGKKPVVVFCSTISSKARIAEVLAAGADAYITKPFDLEILRNKFSELDLI